MGKLTENDIREAATGQSFDRGYSYYRNEYVLEVVRRGDIVTAEVEGSQYQPYEVEIILNEDGSLAHAYCDCPYDWGGYCKHIVAVLLTLIHDEEAVAEKPELGTLLADLDAAQLRLVIINAAAGEPKLADVIEKEIRLLQKAGSDTAVSPQPLAADINAVRRAMRTAWRRSGQGSGRGMGGYFYDEYDGMEIYSGDIYGEHLAKVGELLDVGELDTAVALITVVIDEWITGIQDLDEWVYEYNMDSLAEDSQDLAVALAEVLLSLDLPPEEREEWLDQIEGWNDELGGGLEAAETAVSQWWDYPPLVKAMQGNITEQGAWEGEAPWYADNLADARLRILARQGRQSEYINLALAEGKTREAAQMMVRAGRIEEAVNNAKSYLVYPSEILQVAQTLVEAGAADKGIELAQHGLTIPRNEGKTELAHWLRQQAEASGQLALALQAAQTAFTAGHALEDYQEVERLAGEQWPQIKPKLLKSLESAWTTPQVNVYLYENMLEEAMRAVDAQPYSGDMELERVAAAVKDQYPDWVIKKYQAKGEAIMDAGKAKYYDTAASWLQKARDVYREHGREAEWQAYLDRVLEKHQRKYKLVPLLRQIR
ncbi:MAG: SWIM zinc finger domain-containing protein [Chloroflexi bacterium]|nr:SWIM zinc finger domain-containing protein [Chloroflexota bacterium]